jgi:hypothetical protein
VPETFSSEIADVDERRGEPSFTSEFRGASDSLIERDRPPRALDIGRRGRRMMLVLILSVAALGGGGWALWYWSEPIGEWIASFGSDAEQQPAAADEPPPAEPAVVEPPPAEPEKVFGVKGAPEGSERPSTQPPAVTAPPGELPSEPSKPASVTVASTSIRGKVSSASVGSRLAGVETALQGCWTSAAAKPETKRPATLTVRLGIKWNGRLLSTTIEGDAPDSVEGCVREALPGSGWPQPRDGGDATVERSWTLE